MTTHVRMKHASSICCGAIAAALLAAGAAQANRYTVVDLGTHLYAWDFNDRGEILARRHQHKAYTNVLRRNGRWETFDPAQGYLWAINERGDATGSTADNHPAVWLSDGSYDVLALPEGTLLASGIAMSDDRTVLGQDESSRGIYGCFVAPWMKAPVDIGMPDSQAFYCQPVAINDKGWIAGWTRWTAGPSTVDHSFVWKDGQFHDIGALDEGQNTYAASMNRQGDVVGYAGTALAQHAFLWNGTQMLDIGQSDRFRNATAALHISNRGEIVGYGFDTDFNQKAVRYAQGAAVALEDEVSDLGGMTLDAADDVNDEGVILCQATLDGKAHTVLLVPRLDR